VRVNRRAGDYNKWVTLSEGRDDNWTPLSPEGSWAAIEPQAPGTSGDQRSVTHLVRLPFHPGVTVDSKVTYDGRDLFVRGYQNVNEDGVELRLLCEEVIP
jgi:hypothetical protein